MCKAVLAAVGLLFVLAGCTSTGGFPPQTAEETEKIPAKKRIEISLTPGTFQIEEVEFHVDPSSVPEQIRALARELIGGTIADCEVEYHGSELYYEVTCLVDGEEKEVMFTSDFEPHRWEVGTAESEVPKAVMEAARLAVPGADVTKCEAILDGDRNLLEYHFKLKKEGIKYKAVVSLAGKVERLYRETIGEIEVPLDI